jgi:hypothetical protein
MEGKGKGRGRGKGRGKGRGRGQPLPHRPLAWLRHARGRRALPAPRTQTPTHTSTPPNSNSCIIPGIFMLPTPMLTNFDWSVFATIKDINSKVAYFKQLRHYTAKLFSAISSR